jgi:hypothetical protein
MGSFVFGDAFSVEIGGDFRGGVRRVLSIRNSIDGQGGSRSIVASSRGAKEKKYNNGWNGKF